MHLHEHVSLFFFFFPFPECTCDILAVVDLDSVISVSFQHLREVRVYVYENFACHIFNIYVVVLFFSLFLTYKRLKLGISRPNLHIQTSALNTLSGVCSYVQWCD